jgi:hypothetical protein
MIIFALVGPLIAVACYLIFWLLRQNGFLAPTINGSDFIVGEDAYVTIANGPPCATNGTLRGPKTYIMERAGEFKRLIFIKRSDYFYMKGVKLAIAGGITVLPSNDEMLRSTTFATVMSRAVMAIAAMCELTAVFDELTENAKPRGIKPTGADSVAWFWKSIQKDPETPSVLKSALKAKLNHLVKHGYVTGDAPHATFRQADGNLFYNNQPIASSTLNIYHSEYSHDELMSLYTLAISDVTSMHLAMDSSSPYMQFSFLQKYYTCANNIVAAARQMPVLFKDTGLPILITFKTDTNVLRINYLNPTHTAQMKKDGFKTFKFTPERELPIDIFSYAVKRTPAKSIIKGVTIKAAVNNDPNSRTGITARKSDSKSWRTKDKLEDIEEIQRPDDKEYPVIRRLTLRPTGGFAAKLNMINTIVCLFCIVGASANIQELNACIRNGNTSVTSYNHQTYNYGKLQADFSTSNNGSHVLTDIIYSESGKIFSQTTTSAPFIRNKLTIGHTQNATHYVDIFSWENGTTFVEYYQKAEYTYYFNGTHACTNATAGNNTVLVSCAKTDYTIHYQDGLMSQFHYFMDVQAAAVAATGSVMCHLTTYATEHSFADGRRDLICRTSVFLAAAALHASVILEPFLMTASRYIAYDDTPALITIGSGVYSAFVNFEMYRQHYLPHFMQFGDIERRHDQNLRIQFAQMEVQQNIMMAAGMLMYLPAIAARPTFSNETEILDSLLADSYIYAINKVSFATLFVFNSFDELFASFYNPLIILSMIVVGYCGFRCFCDAFRDRNSRVPALICFLVLIQLNGARADEIDQCLVEQPSNECHLDESPIDLTPFIDTVFNFFTIDTILAIFAFFACALNLLFAAKMKSARAGWIGIICASALPAALAQTYGNAKIMLDFSNELSQQLSFALCILCVINVIVVHYIYFDAIAITVGFAFTAVSAVLCVYSGVPLVILPIVSIFTLGFALRKNWILVLVPLYAVLFLGTAVRFVEIGTTSNGCLAINRHLAIKDNGYYVQHANCFDTTPLNHLTARQFYDAKIADQSGERSITIAHLTSAQIMDKPIRQYHVYVVDCMDDCRLSGSQYLQDFGLGRFTMGPRDAKTPVSPAALVDLGKTFYTIRDGSGYNDIKELYNGVFRFSDEVLHISEQDEPDLIIPGMNNPTGTLVIEQMISIEAPSFIDEVLAAEEIKPVFTDNFFDEIFGSDENEPFQHVMCEEATSEEEILLSAATQGTFSAKVFLNDAIANNFLTKKEAADAAERCRNEKITDHESITAFIVSKVPALRESVLKFKQPESASVLVTIAPQLKQAFQECKATEASKEAFMRTVYLTKDGSLAFPHDVAISEKSAEHLGFVEMCSYKLRTGPKGVLAVNIENVRNVQSTKFRFFDETLKLYTQYTHLKTGHLYAIDSFDGSTYTIATSDEKTDCYATRAHVDVIFTGIESRCNHIDVGLFALHKFENIYRQIAGTFDSSRYNYIRKIITNSGDVCDKNSCYISLAESKSIPYSLLDLFTISETAVVPAPQFAEASATEHLQELIDHMLTQCAHFEVFYLDGEDEKPAAERVAYLIYDSRSSLSPLASAPENIYARCVNSDQYIRSRLRYSNFNAKMPVSIGLCSMTPDVNSLCFFYNAGPALLSNFIAIETLGSATIYTTKTGFFVQSDSLADLIAATVTVLLTPANFIMLATFLIAFIAFSFRQYQIFLTYTISLLSVLAVPVLFPSLFARSAGIYYLFYAFLGRNSFALHLAMYCASLNARPEPINILANTYSRLVLLLILAVTATNIYTLAFCAITLTAYIINFRVTLWDRPIKIKSVGQAERLLSILSNFKDMDGVENYEQLVSTARRVASGKAIDAEFCPSSTRSDPISVCKNLILSLQHPLAAASATLQAIPVAGTPNVSVGIKKFYDAGCLYAVVYENQIVLQSHALKEKTMSYISKFNWEKQFSQYGTDFRVDTTRTDPESIIYINFTPNGRFNFRNYEPLAMSRWTERTAYIKVEKGMYPILVNHTGTSNSPNIEGLCGSPIFIDVNGTVRLLGYHCAKIRVVGRATYSVWCDHRGLVNGIPVNGIPLATTASDAFHKDLCLVGIAHAALTALQNHLVLSISSKYKPVTSSLTQKAKDYFGFKDGDLEKYISRLQLEKPMTRPVVSEKMWVALTARELNTRVHKFDNVQDFSPLHDSYIAEVDEIARSLRNGQDVCLDIDADVTLQSAEYTIYGTCKWLYAACVTPTLYVIEQIASEYANHYPMILGTACALAFIALVYFIISERGRGSTVYLQSADFDPNSALFSAYKNTNDSIFLRRKLAAENFMKNVLRLVRIEDPNRFKTDEILTTIREAADDDMLRAIVYSWYATICDFIRDRFPTTMLTAPVNAVLQSYDEIHQEVRELFLSTPNSLTPEEFDLLVSDSLEKAIMDFGAKLLHAKDFSAITSLATILETRSTDLTKAERKPFFTIAADIRREAKGIKREQNVVAAEHMKQKAAALKLEKETRVKIDRENTLVARQAAKDTAYTKIMHNLVAFALKLTDDSIDQILGDSQPYFNKLVGILEKYQKEAKSTGMRMLFDISDELEPEDMDDIEAIVELQAMRTTYVCGICHAEFTTENLFVQHVLHDANACRNQSLHKHPCGQVFKQTQQKSIQLINCASCKKCNACAGHPRPVNWQVVHACINDGFHGKICPDKKCNEPTCTFDHSPLLFSGVSAKHNDVTATLQAMANAIKSKIRRAGNAIYDGKTMIATLDDPNSPDFEEEDGIYIRLSYLANKDYLVDILSAKH